MRVRRSFGVAAVSSRTSPAAKGLVASSSHFGPAGRVSGHVGSHSASSSPSSSTSVALPPLRTRVQVLPPLALRTR